MQEKSFSGHILRIDKDELHVMTRTLLLHVIYYYAGTVMITCSSP